MIEKGLITMAAPILKQKTDNVITLSLVDGRLVKKQEVKYNKDGSIDKRHSNKVTGVSSEVYPFTTQEEIKKVINVFNERIEDATNENQRQIATRNKMLFLIGINISLRASDLVTLKWNFFFEDDGKFKQLYTLQPKKQRKQKKFVKLYFNQAVRKAVSDYIEEYPIQDINEYLFKSRKGDGAISERALWKIMNDVAVDAGIQKNIGSHSLRKTFGFWAWHNAEDKNKALVTLQMLFNHSDSMTTMKYIGLMNSEIEEMFNSVDLGLDDI
jgi:integrase